MIKEIEFSDDQKGFGLVFTDPVSGIRVLAGIYDTRNEAEEAGQEGVKMTNMIRPEVVTWDRKTYEEHDWIFKKKE